VARCQEDVILVTLQLDEAHKAVYSSQLLCRQTAMQLEEEKFRNANLTRSLGCLRQDVAAISPILLAEIHELGVEVQRLEEACAWHKTKASEAVRDTHISLTSEVMRERLAHEDTKAMLHAQLCVAHTQIHELQHMVEQVQRDKTEQEAVDQRLARDVSETHLQMWMLLDALAKLGSFRMRTGGGFVLVKPHMHAFRRCRQFLVCC
jgi:hypothetical protein